MLAGARAAPAVLAGARAVLAVLAGALAVVLVAGCAQKYHLEVPAGGYGRAADHTWLAGRLEAQTAPAGALRLRYAPEGSPEARADAHAGVISLGSPPVLRGFEAGQWVKVTGRLAEGSTDAADAPAAYKTITIHRFDGPAEQ